MLLGWQGALTEARLRGSVGPQMSLWLHGSSSGPMGMNFRLSGTGALGAGTDPVPLPPAPASSASAWALSDATGSLALAASCGALADGVAGAGGPPGSALEEDRRRGDCAAGGLPTTIGNVAELAPDCDGAVLDDVGAAAMAAPAVPMSGDPDAAVAVGVPLCGLLLVPMFDRPEELDRMRPAALVVFASRSSRLSSRSWDEDEAPGLPTVTGGTFGTTAVLPAPDVLATRDAGVLSSGRAPPFAGPPTGMLRVVASGAAAAAAAARGGVMPEIEGRKAAAAAPVGDVRVGVGAALLPGMARGRERVCARGEVPDALRRVPRGTPVVPGTPDCTAEPLGVVAADTARLGS
jgi:hypothetical protein